MLAVWVAGAVRRRRGHRHGFPAPDRGRDGTARTGDEEGAKASAGINTVFILASAFSAALAGLLVNLGEPSLIRSAQYLLFTFAAVALLGAVPARAASRSIK